MKVWLTAAIVVLGVAVLVPPAQADIGAGQGGLVPGTAHNFTLVGHTSLAGRGMNAAPAIYQHFVYVGNRTDGSNRCGAGDPRIPVSGPDSCPHAMPGIAVV